MKGRQVEQLKFSPDGESLAIGLPTSNGAKIAIWDLSSTTVHREFLGLRTLLLTYNDNALVALEERDQRPSLVAVPSHKRLPIGDIPEGIQLTCFAAMTDVEHLVLGFSSGDILLVDSKTGQVRARLQRPDKKPAGAIDISSDSTLLACSSTFPDPIVLWKIEIPKDESNE